MSRQTKGDRLKVRQEVIDADGVCLLATLHALLWINDPKALHNLEITLVCLGNVHVHSNVVDVRSPCLTSD